RLVPRQVLETGQVGREGFAGLEIEVESHEVLVLGQQVLRAWIIRIGEEGLGRIGVAEVDESLDLLDHMGGPHIADQGRLDLVADKIAGNGGMAAKAMNGLEQEAIRLRQGAALADEVDVLGPGDGHEDPQSLLGAGVEKVEGGNLEK